jgi:hypothetical protein
MRFIALPVLALLIVGVASGLLARKTVAQRSGRSALPTRPPRPRSSVPAAAEAVGYLGGILAIVGVSLLVARSWSQLAFGGRLGVLGGAALLLTAAGFFVRAADRDPALGRLQAFIWLVAGGAVGAFAAVATLDGIDTRHPETVVAVTAAAVAVHSAALWAFKTRPVQQLVTLGASVVAVAAALRDVPAHWTAGPVLLALAIGLFILGARRLTPSPWVTLLVGAIGAVAGAGYLISSAQGPGRIVLLAVATTLVLLAVRVGGFPTLAERWELGVVGTLTLWFAGPYCVVWFARDAGLVTGLLIAAGGAGVMALADREWVHMPHVLSVLGGLGLIGGIAVTGIQSAAFATLFGLAVGAALIALGMIPGRVVLSVIGSVALLIYVPWAITWFFPGQGRAALVISVAGGLLVVLAVMLTRMGHRFGDEFHHHHHHPA